MMSTSRELTLWMDYLDKAHYDEKKDRIVFDKDVPKEAINSYNKWEEQHY